MSFSEAIRAENRDVWDAMIRHRFVREIVEGRMTRQSFERYLLLEGAFVERAVTIFAYALADAPSMDARRRLAAGLHQLTYDQVAYFERVLGRPAGEFAPPVESVAASGLGDALLGFAAHGGFSSALAAMLAAEWMYETWCREALDAGIEDERIREWVELHVGGTFAEQVAWLRDETDRMGNAAGPDLRREFSSIFRRTLLYEIAFHDAVFASGR